MGYQEAPKSYRTFRLQPHGHTVDSDGTNTAQEIVAAAIAAGFTHLAITDHNVVKGVPKLYAEADRLNQKAGVPVLDPVMGIEITYGPRKDIGDVVALKFGPLDDTFLHEMQGTADQRKTYDVKDAIQKTVDLGGVAYIVHPGLPLAHSIPMEWLRTWQDHFSDETRKYIAVEQWNYAARLFGPHTVWRESRLAKLLDELDFIRFGGADYHNTVMVHQVGTLVEAADGSAESMMDALANRRTTPFQHREQQLADYLHLLPSAARAFHKVEIEGRLFAQKVNGHNET